MSSFLPVRALKEKLQRGEAISKAERQAVLGLLAREQKEGRFWNGEIPSLVGGIRELLAEAKATLHGGKIPKAADGRREWNAGKVILVTPSDVTSIADYLNPLIEVVSRQEKAYGLLRASLNRFLFLEKDRLSNETFSDSQAKELLRAIEALEKLGSTAPSEG